MKKPHYHYEQEEAGGGTSLKTVETHVCHRTLLHKLKERFLKLLTL